MANILFTGKVQKYILAEYPELSEESFNTELQMYCDKFPNTNLQSHINTFTALSAEIKALFPTVEKLMRILAIPPASSCSAERSFSALRRLKTWLGACMKQARLNHIAVCHVHRRRLKQISCNDIARQFVGKKETRKTIFGKF